MCFNNFHKYLNNSHSFIQPVHKVFNIEKEAEPKEQENIHGLIFTKEPEIENINKKSLFSLNLKNFHLFLSNLNIDRFQFLRQKFSVIPIYYLVSSEKSFIESQLKKKNIFENCEKYFF